MATRRRLGSLKLVLSFALLGLLFSGGGRVGAQSIAEEELFNPVEVVEGIKISRRECQWLEGRHTAIWIEARGHSTCLRYYAWGLEPTRNPIAVAWLNGDVLGPRGNNADKRQKGFGPMLVLAEQKEFAEAHHVPTIFIARPGTYGSGGKHHDLRGRPLEADLVDAALRGIKSRYGIESFSLGGHSGGGTLVAELLARRNDLKCAVISSGAGAYRAFLERRGIIRERQFFDRFDPITSVDDVPANPTRRIFVIGDPRETNIPFATQQTYYNSLIARGLDAVLIPLRKATDPRHHNLVDFGRAATGLCASGAATVDIVDAVTAMPEQRPRVTN